METSVNTSVMLRLLTRDKAGEPVFFFPWSCFGCSVTNIYEFTNRCVLSPQYQRRHSPFVLCLWRSSVPPPDVGTPSDPHARWRLQACSKWNIDHILTVSANIQNAAPQTSLMSWIQINTKASFLIPPAWQLALISGGQGESFISIAILSLLWLSDLTSDTYWHSNIPKHNQSCQTDTLCSHFWFFFGKSNLSFMKQIIPIIICLQWNFLFPQYFLAMVVESGAVQMTRRLSAAVHTA